MDGKDKGWYANRRALGKCHKCKLDAVPGRASCQHHLDAERQLKKDKRNAAIKVGMCSRCLKVPHLEERRYCDPCLKKTAQENKTVRARKRKTGKCYLCGKNAVRELGKNNVKLRRCQKHREQVNTYSKAAQRRTQRERMAAGLCVRCGVFPPKEYGLLTCRPCLAAAENRRMLRKEVKEYEKRRHRPRSKPEADAPTQDVHPTPGRNRSPARVG